MNIELLKQLCLTPGPPGGEAPIRDVVIREGDKVLMIEREDRIGGCMYTSDQVTLPGYHHDVMAATFVLFLTGPAHGALGEDLAKHGLEFCHTQHPTAVLRPDGSALTLSMDRDANVAAFNAPIFVTTGRVLAKAAIVAKKDARIVSMAATVVAASTSASITFRSANNADRQSM